MTTTTCLILWMPATSFSGDVQVRADAGASARRRTFACAPSGGWQAVSSSRPSSRAAPPCSVSREVTKVIVAVSWQEGLRGG